MPRPVPPPPPQPSAEETVIAVRYARWLAVIAALLFVGWASTYGNSAAMVEYGRDNGASWNLRKARLLDADQIRPPGDGHVAWLIGSSILRESFDEEVINRVLMELQLPWRVVKFGQTRGASGLSSGMLSRLPIRPGDLVIHNVAVENFRADWLDFTELPDWRVLMLLDDQEIWEIDEWSTAQKLELLVARPKDFYRYHEEAMQGWFRWLDAPMKGRTPSKRATSMHTRFKTLDEHRKLKRVRRKGLKSRNTIQDDELDLRDAQFNMQGIQRMRQQCAELGVELVLVDLPQRQEYRDTYLQSGVWVRWSEWMSEQPELVHFPQPPDGDFYDMKHPNSRGRLQLSTFLVQWLNKRHIAASSSVIERQ